MYSSFLSFHPLFLLQHEEIIISLNAVTNQTLNRKCLQELFKSSSSKEYASDAFEILTNEKNFLKIINQ